MTCVIVDNVANIKIPLERQVPRVKSCDIYIGERDLVFSCDNHIFRLVCEQKFDTKDMKQLEISYDSSNRQFSCDLPCLPLENEPEDNKKAPTDSEEDEGKVDVLKLQRITDNFVLLLDGETGSFQQEFSYGFSSSFTSDTSLVEENLKPICKISNPSKCSPIERWLKREADENKDFCKDVYKLNFIELEIPAGFENPINYRFNFEEHKLTNGNTAMLENLKKKNLEIAPENQIEIDCGLVSILLAICYDIRTTSNESTCESAWTRNILSSCLSYFEIIDNLKTAVDVFLRRSLTYPLHRNYPLSRLCVEDAIEALNRGQEWITYQLFTTRDLFSRAFDSRQLLNKYYIDKYIQYCATVVTKEHLSTLSRNLKNVLLSVKKRDLNLNLCEVEVELLQELCDDFHIAKSDDSDDEEDEDECEDSDVSSESEDSEESDKSK